MRNFLKILSNSPTIIILSLVSTHIFGQPAMTRQEKMQRFSQFSIAEKKEKIRERVIALREAQLEKGKSTFRVLVVGAGGGGGHRSSGFSIKKVLTSLNSQLPPSVHKDRYELALRKTGFFEVAYCEPMYFEATPWNTALDNHNIDRLQSLQNIKFYADLLINMPGLKEHVFLNINTSMEHPDVIIQAQVLSTKRVAKIADRLGADFRLVPTDFMLDAFVSDIDHGSPIKIDLGITPEIDPSLSEILAEKDLKNHIHTGYPVRYEFLTLAEELRSHDPIIKAQAEANLDADLLKSDGINKDDKTILIMMGARGTALDLMAQYVRDVANVADSLVQGSQKVHLFVAKILPDELSPPAAPSPEGRTLTEFSKDLEDYTAQLMAYRKNLGKMTKQYLNAFSFVQKLEEEINYMGSKSLVLHFTSKMEADKVAKLMYRGISLVKTGGASAGELMCMGGFGVFPMDISHYIKWEKHAADLFHKHDWGIPLPLGQTDEERLEFLKVSLQAGFSKLASNRAKMPRNYFHLDWTYLFIEDALERLKSNL